MKDMKAVRDEMALNYYVDYCVGYNDPDPKYFTTSFKAGFDSASAIYEERESKFREVIEKQKMALELYQDLVWNIHPEKEEDRYVARTTLAETAKLLEGL